MSEELTKQQKLAKLRRISANLVEKEGKKGYDARIGFLDDENMKNVGHYELMPIGIPSIDKYLGGGMPRGGHVHFAGLPDIGKTTVCLNLIANAQKAGLVCAFADLEMKFDAKWAEKQGVNTAELVLGRFDVAEAAFEWVKDVSAVADIIVMDSLTALASRKQTQTKAGSDKDFDNETMGTLAKLAAQYLRIAQPTVVKNQSTVIVINHLYDKIDLFGGKTTGGGNAIKYWAILELWGSKSQVEEKELKDKAFNLKLTTKKGHYTGAPAEGSFIETVFFKNEGFHIDYELVLAALEDGRIRVDGSKTYYTDKNGKEHDMVGFKPLKVLGWMQDEGLLDDLKGLDKKEVKVTELTEPVVKKGRKKKIEAYINS